MATMEEIVKQADLLGYRGEKREEYLKQEFKLLAERQEKKEGAERQAREKKEEAERQERKEKEEAERQAREKKEEADRKKRLELEKMKLDAEMKLLQAKIEAVKTTEVNTAEVRKPAESPTMEVADDLQREVEGGMLKLASGKSVPVMTNCAALRDPEKTRSLGLPVLKGEIGGCEVYVMRDTGCEGVVVRKQLVDASQLTGQIANKMTYFMWMDYIIKALT
ncbi:hypothetical protein PoB_002717100 [Plakobranchus ocellatus]|uniref:Uncharacterized protein n=1 Tax=Plakobranchus ocellatus TaxID=259542 RepID=A0AAV3ZXM6_9GAST|nr:hypothetical protein PoB_002717100 [Plakobranchus ocellatus]